MKTPIDKQNDNSVTTSSSTTAANAEVITGDFDSLPEVDNFWASTHAVTNQPTPLENYNLYQSDLALQEAVTREGNDVDERALEQFGALTGSADIIELGFQANENKPSLYTHDRFGNRVDELRFHPAYHRLMSLSLKHDLHNPWDSEIKGAHIARSAQFYMMAQVEAGHGCPITMTCAAIPALKNQSNLFEAWAPKILCNDYDPRNVAYWEKNSLTIGMAMTEKQGGSDVRQNSTRAIPLRQGGSGELYELLGHKYFVSAPMCDAFLVLAQAPGGLSCFLMPRWREDGRKNALQLQRLKNKMGNVSNASCETELRGAQAWMVGEEGRGVATILDMVVMTRFDCMLGSAGAMRQAVAQATHHCGERMAFGKLLSTQPLMQNVLADLIVEHESALALTMRIGRALDLAPSNDYEQHLVRIGTAIGKYWICKRTPGHAYEAMECLGGSGVMEDCIMPRLFRESPVNAIWEGSGNIQCLDMLRAVNRNPETLEVFMSELELARGGDSRLDRAIDELGKEFIYNSDIEYRARGIVEKMALAMQASILTRAGNSDIAEAFCASRLDSEHYGHLYGRLYGCLPRDLNCQKIVARAMP